MTSAGQAQDAVRALNGSAHGGRMLMVNEARPKLYSNRERESLAGRDHRRHGSSDYETESRVSQLKPNA